MDAYETSEIHNLIWFSVSGPQINIFTRKEHLNTVFEKE
jgi:hypothetical protein